MSLYVQENTEKRDINMLVLYMKNLHSFWKNYN